jgi:hypothetical protein
MWKVSGITHKGALASEPFYRLGYFLERPNKYIELVGPEQVAIRNVGRHFLLFKEFFVSYFDRGVRERHDDAVRFLVALAAFMMGVDDAKWDWEQVRHLSQGLWGSLDETPSEFRLHNLPLIEGFSQRIKVLIETSLVDNEHSQGRH